MNELNSLADRIRVDLAAFADAGSSISLNPTRAWLQASWDQHGRLTTASFKAKVVEGIGSIRVRTPAGDEISYAAFLAGDRMGDLRSVARNTVGAIRPVPAFVAPRACLGQGASATDANGLLEGLAKAVDPLTKLVFITADAGVGKTSLLTELVRRKATDYALGRGGPLWLYVNAQGSRLAKLDQALAAALDDVRAPFPYHAVAALVRAEALVIVIDGFDELIGAPGTYDDAYSSLASFLQSLDGQGTIVATARSAYYEQEFLARVGTVAGFSSDAWSLRRVELSSWNDNERSKFLAEFAKFHGLAAGSTAQFTSEVLSVFEETNLKELVSKPFFLARVAQFSVEGRGLEPGPSLLDRLINTYLARDAHGKLLTSVGGPVLTEVQLATLYEEIANEMWREETRELSRTSFRELVDVAAQVIGISDEAREVVVDRLPNSALVHGGTSAGTVAFEHEIFFSYFLARPIVGTIASGDPFKVATALRRGRLTNQAGEIAGRGLASGATAVLATLRQAPDAVSQGGDQIRQNAGAIVAGMLREGIDPGSIVANVDFVDIDLARVEFADIRFESCSFRGVDFRGAGVKGCTANNVVFEAPLLDASTRLGLTGPSIADFHGVMFYDPDGTPTSFYSPEDIERVLGWVGFPVGARPQFRDVSAPIRELVDTFARIFEHTNIAALEDEFVMKRVVRNAAWPAVFDALLASGVCVEELRAAGGNKSFVRMTVRPRDLLAGLGAHAVVDDRVSAFWDAVQVATPGRA
jgi:hypothetical protein